MTYLVYHTQQMISYKGKFYICQTQTNFLPEEKVKDWKEVLRENFPSFDFEIIEPTTNNKHDQ